MTTNNHSKHTSHAAEKHKAEELLAEKLAAEKLAADKRAAAARAAVPAPAKPAAQAPALAPVSTTPPSTLSAQGRRAGNLQARLEELQKALTPDLASLSPDVKAALDRLGGEINGLLHEKES